MFGAESAPAASTTMAPTATSDGLLIRVGAASAPGGKRPKTLHQDRVVISLRVAPPAAFGTGAGAAAGADSAAGGAASAAGGPSAAGGSAGGEGRAPGMDLIGVCDGHGHLGGKKVAEYYIVKVRKNIESRRRRRT